MRVTNVRMLAGDGGTRLASIHLADGRIATIGPDGMDGVDARGLLALPGIVDLHGDAWGCPALC